jgi:hypothetical protein
MTLISTCQFAEFFLLILCILRFILIKKPFNQNSIEILFFVVLLTLDEFIGLNWEINIYTFNFIHVFIPVMFCCTILLNKKIKLVYIIVLQLLISSIEIYLMNYEFIIYSYLFSIMLIIHKGIKLAGQSSSQIKIAPLYFFLGFDQILSFIVMLMYKLDYNWQSSLYIDYFNIFFNLFFPLTILYINVKFRRLIFI